MKQDLTCRYGHGPLTRQDGFWSLNGVEVVSATAESTVEELSHSFFQNGRGFTVVLYRCPQCGYLELFDDVTDNE